MALCAGLNLANASSSSGSSANNSPSFEYQDQVFKRYAASNLDESLPSLAQLYQDAKVRKTHLDGLFSFLETHKLTQPTMDLFKDVVTFRHTSEECDRLKNGPPDDVIVLALLKDDYAIERDLMTYFVNALEAMVVTPPTQAQMEELYTQTIFTTRLNLQGLGDSVFEILRQKYPECFFYHSNNGVRSKAVDMTIFDIMQGALNEEEQALFRFTKDLSPAQGTLHATDTVKIAQHARTLFGATEITNPAIIFDLNSLSFYLNLERALLAACASLRFEPCKYGFQHKDERSGKDRFVLSALLDYHRRGLLTNAGSRDYSPAELSLLKRSKDKLFAFMLKDEAHAPINTMLARLGITRSPPERTNASSIPTTEESISKKTKASGKKKKGKGPSKQKKTRSRASMSATLTVKVSAPARPLLLECDENDVDQSLPLIGPAQAEASWDEEDNTSFLSVLVAGTSQSSTHVARYVPHLDDYLFKRNIAWTQHINRATYTFKETTFDMDGTFFPREQLLRVKELTGHKPGQAKLPNLASAHLRFHYTVGGIDKSYDFVPQERYLSGGFRFARNEPYRTTAHIQNAYHNALSPQDQRAFLMESPIARSQRIAQVTTRALDHHVAKGPWNINSADSEGILLLDLTKHLPRYLGQLAALEDAPLHIQGVVLGVSTYRDPCWRCRNLLQGWQWGLENALTVAIQDQALPITVAPNLPTIVYGFGEIKPDSRDFFPPPMIQKKTVLSTAGESDYASNTHKLRLVSMRH